MAWSLPWRPLQKVSSLEHTHTALLRFVEEDHVLKACSWFLNVPGEEPGLGLQKLTEAPAAWGVRQGKEVTGELELVMAS